MQWGGRWQEAGIKQRRLMVVAWAVLVVAVGGLALHSYDSFQLGTSRDAVYRVVTDRSGQQF